jgi:hypothetical protein
LVLCGRRLTKTPNNQPRVSGSGRGDVIAEAGVGGGAGGGHRPNIWGSEWNNKKINNKKYIMAFGGLRSKIIQQPTKNGWARGRRGWRRGTNMGEWQRDANAPRPHVEGEKGQHTTSSTIAHCWVMMLSTMTPIR